MIEEVALYPEQRICDPHHHLWDHDGDRYLAGDFARDIDASGHDIVSTVYVQAGNPGYYETGPVHIRPTGETAWAVAMSDDVLMRGIVGFVDLRHGDRVSEALAAHREAAPGRFCGVRHNLAWSDDPRIPASAFAELHLAESPRFREGLAVVAREGIPFDATIFSPQLPEIGRVASHVPELVIVLDHFGIPLCLGNYAAVFDDVVAKWKSDLRQLAQFDNVRIKLGGVGIPMIGPRWDGARGPSSEELAELWRPYVDWSIGQFGVDRCMFESNFPVDRKLCSYRVIWNTYKRLAEGFSRDERDALFRRTAEKTYAL